LTDTIRGPLRRLRDKGEAFSLLDHREYFVHEAEAVAAVTGHSKAEYRAVLDELWSPLDDDPASQPTFGGRPSLIRIAAGSVRLISPKTVVETGVAQGVTTAAILHALELNGNGHLHSIDLPALHEDAGSFVGRLVPSELRSRWMLELGPSRKLLPRLVARLGQLDVFLHDAEHSYRSQLAEYRVAWPHIRPGGILLSDDVGNPAFIEFAEIVGARPYLVGDPHVASAVGLLRKRS
jgi:predicted O-methyltransferase YrrM